MRRTGMLVGGLKSGMVCEGASGMAIRPDPVGHGVVRFDMGGRYVVH
jgi:hypothetical protein